MTVEWLSCPNCGHKTFLIRQDKEEGTFVNKCLKCDYEEVRELI